jgi:hypothetical protein
MRSVVFSVLSSRTKSWKSISPMQGTSKTDKFNCFIQNITSVRNAKFSCVTLSNGHTTSPGFFLEFKKYAKTIADTAESRSHDSLPMTKVSLVLALMSFKLQRNEVKSSSIAMFCCLRGKQQQCILF